MVVASRREAIIAAIRETTPHVLPPDLSAALLGAGWRRTRSKDIGKKR
jgi:hypothetical protein